VAVRLLHDDRRGPVCPDREEGRLHRLSAPQLLAEDGPDQGRKAGQGLGDQKDRDTLPHQLPDGEGRDDGALRPFPKGLRYGAEGGSPSRIFRRGDRPPDGDEADHEEGIEALRRRPGASRRGEDLGDRDCLGRDFKVGEGRKEGAASEVG